MNGVKTYSFTNNRISVIIPIEVLEQVGLSVEDNIKEVISQLRMLSFEVNDFFVRINANDIIDYIKEVSEDGSELWLSMGVINLGLDVTYVNMRDEIYALREFEENEENLLRAVQYHIEMIWDLILGNKVEEDPTDLLFILECMSKWMLLLKLMRMQGR